MTELIKALSEVLPPGTLILVVPPAGPEAVWPGEPGSGPEPAVSEYTDDAPLTLSQWGKKLTGVSTRELERAHKHGALRTQIREKGLGHGAVEATAPAISEYIQTCSAVQDGIIAPPEWWSRVRKGSNGRVRG